MVITTSNIAALHDARNVTDASGFTWTADEQSSGSVWNCNEKNSAPLHAYDLVHLPGPLVQNS